MPKDLNPEQVRLVSFGAGNTATRFEKDRILVTGGYRRSYMDPGSKFEFGADARAVWFDPIGCVGTLASPMKTKRQSHTATDWLMVACWLLEAPPNLQGLRRTAPRPRSRM